MSRTPVSGTIVLVDHSTGKRDDRASARLAEWGYRLEWVRPATGDPLPRPAPEHAGAIVYGGAESANDDLPYIRAELDWIERWVAGGKPFLGLCLGGQMLARVLGAPVRPRPDGRYEIGYVPVWAAPDADGFLGPLRHVYHWHKEGFEVPRGATPLAAGPVFPNQAFRYGDNAYALQFHPEATRAVMARWLVSAAHMLANPGAQSRERQLADAEAHDAPLADWLDGFLATWLGDPAGKGRAGHVRMKGDSLDG